MGQSTLSLADQRRETKLCACVEQMLGAKVVHIERQLRWRPAWFLALEKPNGERVKVHARGDRDSDVVPFPELKREADILQTLAQQGVPVPHVYGMCDDPVAIIMETVAGTRDVSAADSDAQRQAVARQYIDALARMHKAPVEPFVAKGIELPVGAEAIALIGVKAYMPLYKKHKCEPDPLIEFALAWLRRNIPRHRTKPSFIAFDAGQFLFDAGKLTALYDFEFAMIGDPLTDLATMAMRQSVEPMGDTIANLCQYYGEVMGEPVDVGVMRYHHTVFATVACMQFVGAIKNPQSGDPHDVYVEWDLALRRSLTNVLAENIGIAVPAPAPVALGEGAHQPLCSMLEDSLAHIHAAAEIDEQQKQATRRLLEYYRRLDQVEPILNTLARTDAQQVLAVAENDGVDAQIEAFIQADDGRNDARIMHYLAMQVERRVQAFGDIGIGQSAAHVRLEPVPKL